MIAQKNLHADRILSTVGSPKSLRRRSDRHLQHRCDVIRAARSDRMVKRSSLHRRETMELSSKKLKILTRGDHALIARRAEGRTCLRIDR